MLKIHRVVLISCKITSSVLSYFQSKGEDTSVLLDGIALPEEFLEDPSYWLQDEEMEKFLSSVVANDLGKKDKILQEISQSIPKLRSWGVFDSVLRMMPLSEVFAQPNRFMSYFISPDIEVLDVQRRAHGISFEVPVSLQSFPLTRQFLMNAFETLPLFSGQALAVCTWVDHRLDINWDTSQENFFQSQDPGHKLSPELLRSIVSQLEQHQIELQQKNADLEARNHQLRDAFQKLQQEMHTTSSQNSHTGHVSLGQPETLTLKKHLARLADYMVRAQQLVTILAGGKSQPPLVKEALRRTDWNWVKENYPLTVASCFELLQPSDSKTDPKLGAPIAAPNSPPEERVTHV